MGTVKDEIKKKQVTVNVHWAWSWLIQNLFKLDQPASLFQLSGEVLSVRVRGKNWWKIPYKKNVQRKEKEFNHLYLFYYMAI